MIKKIKLKDIASYTNVVEICNLKKINFFFGGNGTGKTSLTKVIFNPSGFTSCCLECNGDRNFKTLVFNEDFRDKYFYQSDELKGIFTLGDGAKANEEKIQELREKKEKIEEGNSKLSILLNSKNEEKDKIQENFKNACWEKIFFKYKNDFPEIFKGYRNSKEKLAEKIINKNKDNKSELCSYEKLKERYKGLFVEELERLNELDSIDKIFIEEMDFIEKNEIFKTKIIGKKDVDIFKMIDKLQNHDWVKQGKEYYENNYDEEKNSYICPFCQQETPRYFKKSLEEYFDETYESQIDELNQVIQKYESKIKELEDYFSNIENISGNKYLQNKLEDLKKIKLSIDNKVQVNKELIKNKQSNPSRSIDLQSIIEFLDQNNDIVDGINTNIQEHNDIVKNSKNEEQNLRESIWSYFCNEISIDLDNYIKYSKEIEKAKENINKKIKQNEENIREIISQISSLENKIKSIKPVVDKINNLLSSFGFTGFTLKTTNDNKRYKIIRKTGEPAKKSLSEGEKNLVVFLYFYNLIKGVIDPDESINENKIIVFDDPVSSFDSSVLFLVSTLIKDLIRPLRKGENTNIKQIFVLTHNVYFFKEMTFLSAGEQKNKRNDTMYYIVKKYNGISEIESYEKNPIKTTYQLLWENVKNEKNDLVSIQNNMRRIIEFYFKILANLDEKEILNYFTDINEKAICKSLIAWINIGSHEIFDDICLNSIHDCGVSEYQNIFRLIFEKTNHIAHYNMMMEIKE